MIANILTIKNLEEDWEIVKRRFVKGEKKKKERKKERRAQCVSGIPVSLRALFTFHGKSFHALWKIFSRSTFSQFKIVFLRTNQTE